MRPLPACTHGPGALGRNQRPLPGVRQHGHFACGDGSLSSCLFAPPSTCFWSQRSPAFHGGNADATGSRRSCHASARSFPWRGFHVREYVRWWISTASRCTCLSYRAPGTTAKPGIWSHTAEPRLRTNHFRVHTAGVFSATCEPATFDPGGRAKWFPAAAPSGWADTFQWQLAGGRWHTHWRSATATAACLGQWPGGSDGCSRGVAVIPFSGTDTQWFDSWGTDPAYDGRPRSPGSGRHLAFPNYSVRPDGSRR